jgi:uncharacterized pyridoxal phosphate-containing UPF0001 family protein
MTTSPASSVSDALAQRVAANLIGVHRRIALTGRELSGVRIVAVTKTFDVAHVRVAAALGLSAVGENFVGELCAKRDAAMDVSVVWHYLGALQTNKIQRIVACADVICGVSRLKELERIADHQSDQAVYVQVDFTEAVGRNGAEGRRGARRTGTNPRTGRARADDGGSNGPRGHAARLWGDEVPDGRSRARGMFHGHE